MKLWRRGWGIGFLPALAKRSLAAQLTLRLGKPLPMRPETTERLVDLSVGECGEPCCPTIDCSHGFGKKNPLLDFLASLDLHLPLAPGKADGCIAKPSSRRAARFHCEDEQRSYLRNTIGAFVGASRLWRV